MAGITTVDLVVTHVPGFVRNSPSGVADTQIQTWIDTRWEELHVILQRRGLTAPTNPSDAYSALELINRMGAASDLAAALSSRFSANGGTWAVAKNLREDYVRMLTRLDNGGYDRLLNPATARQENTGPIFSGVAGGETDRQPDPNMNVAFQRGQVF